jgi:hypothetical protein
MNDHRHLTNLHLTDDQFAELVSGAPPASARSHLAGCPACAAEAAEFRNAVTGFSQQSKLWAERRTATHPALNASPLPALTWTMRTTGLAAALLALIVTVGVNIERHQAGPLATSQQDVHTIAAAPVSAATLKADNDLLSAIDGELRVTDSTSSIGRTEHGKSSKRSVSE